jgi:aerobic-type carbon monoxide dehydrogenase small subunit (CoxS/CutS family)
MIMTLRVNGQSHRVDVPENTPLLWVLRDHLGLTGTKYGCGIEVCGACTVLIGGEPKKSCDTDAKEAIEKEVITIEGLSPDGNHPVQRAWIEEQVPQCGYCQSGMILSAVALLRNKPNPSDGDIASEIKNLCVCGTYQRVRKAIHRAAKG